MTINVLLVDDHPLMRKGMAQLLKLDPLFNHIYEADNGTEALAIYTRSKPELIILDLNMKGMSGLDTLVSLKSNGCEALIVILTVSDSQEDRNKLIMSGADAYYLKDLDPELLLDALKILVASKLSYSALGIADLQIETSNKTLLDDLTKREIEILKLVAKGWRNKQIADEIFISEATVKVHIKNILKKLKLDSRHLAALFFTQHSR